MNSEISACVLKKLDSILEALGGGVSNTDADTSTRGSGGTTIPVGATEFGYVAIGGTITVGGVTIPEGVSASESTPAGRAATVAIADGTGVAHWYYCFKA